MMRLRKGANGRICLVQSLLHTIFAFAGRFVRRSRHGCGQRIANQLRRDFARVAAAHAVHDREESVFRQRQVVVFVVLADEPHVREGMAVEERSEIRHSFTFPHEQPV